MSGLFRKEIQTPTPVVTTEAAPAPMGFLGKGTRASNEAPEKTKLDTLDAVSRRAAQRDALRDVSRRARR